MSILAEPWNRRVKLGVQITLAVIVISSIAGAVAHAYRFWDDDPDRGAIAMPKPDHLGEKYDRVTYLEQGWDAADSLWFYNTPQGSDLMPYDFFLVLEQIDSTSLFRDNDNINAYRYLPQKPTFSNPDGLPLGFVRDDYKGREYVGLTCAACHTGQVNFQGQAIRIDGGPAGSDMERFMKDVGRALTATLNDPAKQARFVKAVLALDNYDSEDDVLADLKKFAQRVTTYAVINDPTTPYRYGRLDAFGRIYNRTLEHVMSGDQLKQILSRMLSEEELKVVTKDMGAVLTADDRDHVIEHIQPFLSVKQQLRLRAEIFNSPDAPVSYPFLWDIPQHDYVQWNGLAANAGVGPIGRNAGEVIGVFGSLDWRLQKHGTLSTLIGGQSGGVAQVNYESSVNVANLRRIEHHLHTLQSPVWPEAILGRIDRERARKGARLYAEYCLSCHDLIDRSSPERRVIAQMTGLDAVKTDPKMADNSVGYSGYSGILRNQYVGTDVGDILIQRKAPVAALLTKADVNVVATPDPDKWLIRAWAERIYDFVVTLRDNDINASIKQGPYEPDTTADPFASLRAYKARPLNGIWATAPYLHNGSVPTLRDLLEPSWLRPTTFYRGNDVIDRARVGFVSDVAQEAERRYFAFDTRLPGNGNAGHEGAAYGTELPADDKDALVEYLKTF
ncbi:MAG: hypothetical protein KDF24_06985 [Rhodocyclaceae bacterium]|nr:hypothetical protein [Rhodocyclaceae bacterium]